MSVQPDTPEFTAMVTGKWREEPAWDADTVAIENQFVEDDEKYRVCLYHGQVCGRKHEDRCWAKERGINPMSGRSHCMFSQGEQYVVFTKEAWYCLHCMQTLRHTQLRMNKPEQTACEWCKTPRGNGLNNNSIEHLVCLTPFYWDKSWRPCGHVNNIENTKCENPHCNAVLPGTIPNPTWQTGPNNYDRAKIALMLRGDPTIRDAWVCTEGHRNRPGQPKCSGGRGTGETCQLSRDVPWKRKDSHTQEVKYFDNERERVERRGIRIVDI